METTELIDLLSRGEDNRQQFKTNMNNADPQGQARPGRKTSGAHSTKCKLAAGCRIFWRGTDLLAHRR